MAVANKFHELYGRKPLHIPTTEFQPFRVFTRKHGYSDIILCHHTNGVELQFFHNGYSPSNQTIYEYAVGSEIRIEWQKLQDYITGLYLLTCNPYPNPI